MYSRCLKKKRFSQSEQHLSHQEMLQRMNAQSKHFATGGYRKDSKDIRIPSFVYRKYPKLREALSRRCAVYNEQLEMVERMEDEGQIIVIRPLKPVAVDRIEKDVQKLTEFYQEGYECARALLEE